jgi:IS4 transposase
MSQENIQELTLRRASLQSLNQDMENANGAVEDYIEHLRENGQEKESSELSTRLKKDEEFNKNFKLAIVETASLLAIIFAKTKDVVVTKDLIKKSKEESFTNMKKMFLEASEKDIAQFSKEFLILSKSETDKEIYDMKVHHLENVKGEDFQMYEEENLSNVLTPEDFESEDEYDMEMIKINKIKKKHLDLYEVYRKEILMQYKGIKGN